MNLNERELTTAGRNKLPSSKFVFPKGRRYPIEDKSHARNALARVSQRGSPSEKSKVRSAVHSRYPGIGECQVPPLGEAEIRELMEPASTPPCPYCRGDSYETGQGTYRCRSCKKTFSKHRPDPIISRRRP